MHAAAVTGALPWADHQLTLGDLAQLLRRPAWQADGACREHPEISWFVARGESAAPARRICATCLVRVDCAEWAAAQGLELQGVWGGLTRRDRLAGITTPRPVEDVPGPRCRRCGAKGEALTGRLCERCEKRAATRLSTRSTSNDGPSGRSASRPCVQCGQPTDGVKIHRVEGHPLHAATCYHRARRQAVKLGTTIEAIVEQLARRCDAALTG